RDRRSEPTATAASADQRPHRRMRQLAWGLSPASWEPLASYVDRLAHAYQCPLSDVLKATALASDGPLTPTSFGWQADDERLATFTFVTRLHPHEVDDMLLRRLASAVDGL